MSLRGMKCRGNPLHEDFINPVIASVAKQSPAWNKYSNYYFLSAEIAAGINALAMTLCCVTPSLRGGQSPTKQSPAWNKYSNYYFLSAEIATGINTLAMTVFEM